VFERGRVYRRNELVERVYIAQNDRQAGLGWHVEILPTPAAPV
jgi:hypothetical protein